MVDIPPLPPESAPPLEVDTPTPEAPPIQDPTAAPAPPAAPAPTATAAPASHPSIFRRIIDVVEVVVEQEAPVAEKLLGPGTGTEKKAIVTSAVEGLLGEATKALPGGFLLHPFEAMAIRWLVPKIIDDVAGRLFPHT